ncbi:MAG: AAA family ATPase [Lentisphaeria bacterium]|nr:AAA family ATPase [Lentisphaeria bacterium]
MRIKKLILENINSLYGHWEIDFTSTPFDDGLFAIMGPTGSGKTTILDAICLALFAETPRIKGGAKDITEVVSKGAGSCLAELSFEIDGKDYLASFGFKAYERNGVNARVGEVNPGSMLHSVSCNGKILHANRNTDAGNKIIEIIGMDADQFYRTILLAQGKFDAFLSAGKDRADILEQITRTEIYTRIAKKINEKSSEIKRKLENLQAEQRGCQLLPPETEQTKQAELEGLKKSAAEQTARKNLLDELIRILDRIAAAEKAQRENAAATEELAREKTEFGPDAVRLAAGEKAARILPVFQTFQESEKQLRDKSGELEKITGQIPGLTQKLNECIARAAEAETQSQKCTGEHDRLSGLVSQVSALDEQIRQTKGNLAEQEKQLGSLQSAWKEQTGKRQELEAERQHLETERKQSGSYLAEHAGDDALAEKQARWQEQAKNLKSQARELENRKGEIAALEKKLGQTGDECRKQAELTDQKEAELQRAQAALKQKQSEAAAVLGGDTRDSLELRAERLEQNLNVLKLIPDYLEARKRLEKGQPCPLCGSTEHPYLSEEHRRVVTQDEADLKELRGRLRKLDQAERDTLAAETAENDAKNGKSLAEQELKHLRDSEAAQKADLEQKKDRLEQDRAQYEQAADGLRQQLAETGFQWNGTGGLPKEIGLRIEAWRGAERKLQEFEAARIRLETEIKNLSDRIRESENSAKDLQNKKQKTEAELNALRTERNVLFGDKDPNEEIRKSAARLKSAQAEYDRISREKSAQEKAVQIAGEQKKALEQTVLGLRSGTEQARAGFVAACTAEQFTPEQFEASRLSADELKTLTETRVRLQEKEKQLAEQRQKTEAELQQLRGKLPEGTDREKVTEELSGLQPRLDEMQRQIGALGKELEDNRQKRKGLEKLLGDIAELQKKSELWSQLDKLVGGGNGQNFKRIAQQITLGYLLQEANQAMQRMNGRYELLVSDCDDMLGIDVVDHLRGDEIRTSANLSGGERFQVSLALALGLSSMSGDSIRIDSLFLDEGFGTLDPESLENTLKTLSDLRHSEGKTIGIISHVAAIGEAVPALIEVTPAGGGRSELSGAGVSHGTMRSVSAGRRDPAPGGAKRGRKKDSQ